MTKTTHENFRGVLDVLKDIEKEKKRKDIKDIFEKKKVTRIKIAPHNKHPKPTSKPINS